MATGAAGSKPTPLAQRVLAMPGCETGRSDDTFGGLADGVHSSRLVARGAALTHLPGRQSGGMRGKPVGAYGHEGQILTDIAAIESRIWSLLEPYRERLEDSTIYGMPSLRWPGAKAHDYFAAVRAGKSYVSLYLLVADTYPDALDGTSPALLKRRSGKAAFTFPKLDDAMARDLGALLRRLFDRYAAAHAEG